MLEPAAKAGSPSGLLSESAKSVKVAAFKATKSEVRSTPSGYSTKQLEETIGSYLELALEQRPVQPPLGGVRPISSSPEGP
jgi:hypothetical protein